MHASHLPRDAGSHEGQGAPVQFVAVLEPTERWGDQKAGGIHDGKCGH